MLLLLLGMVFLAVGVWVGRWRVLWLPAVLGGIALVAGGLAGPLQSQDTPVPFLLALATVALATGVVLRRRAWRMA